MAKAIHNAVVTATSNGAAESAGFDTSASYRATLVVSSIGGTTPSFTVAIEDSPDGVNWTQVGTFAAATVDGTESITVTGPTHSNLRCAHTVSGTTPTANIAVYVGP